MRSNPFCACHCCTNATCSCHQNDLQGLSVIFSVGGASAGPITALPLSVLKNIAGLDGTSVSNPWSSIILGSNMAQKEEPMSPPLVSQLADTAKATARASLSPLRQRNLARASVFSEALDASRLRRNSSLSSAFSDTIDDARNSFRSTADDILLPKARSPEVSSGHEPSHWHSIPLALALLPAAGGLMFEKGSTVITDITLLALAAIFLNWSVRLPW